MSNKRIYLLLVIIVLLGTTLRLYDLTGESLWTDEMISLTHIRQGSIPLLIYSVAEMELMPTGYFIFLSYWVKLFGESEFSLRLPSLFFDLGSIILVFLLSSKLFNKKRGWQIGLISSLLCSTVMLQVLYAQEVRPYSLFSFMVLLSTLIFVYFYEKRNLSFFLAYTIVTVLALHINYMAFFLILFHLLAVFLYEDSKNSKFFINGTFMKIHFLSIFAIFILFLPQINVLLRQVQLRQPFLQQFFYSFGIPSFLAQLGLFFYLVPIISLSLIIFLGIIAFKKKKDFFISYLSKKNIFLLLIFLLFIVGGGHLLLLDKTLRSFTLIRHSFFIVPFLYIFVAKGVANFKRIGTIVIIGILIFNAFTLNVYYETVSKPPWREALPFIEENSRDDPLLLFERAGSNIDLYDYYSHQNFRKVDLGEVGLRKINQTNFDNLLQQLNQEDGFWLISSRMMVEKQDYKSLFDEKFELVLEKEYPELSVYYYYT